MNKDDSKIVKFTEKKLQNEKILQDEAGIFYVVAEKDDNGNLFNAKHLIKTANETDYLVQILKIENEKTLIYTYRINGEKLCSFFAQYKDNNPNKRIIEITKCKPQNLA